MIFFLFVFTCLCLSPEACSPEENRGGHRRSVFDGCWVPSFVSGFGHQEGRSYRHSAVVSCLLLMLLPGVVGVVALTVVVSTRLASFLQSKG